MFYKFFSQVKPMPAFVIFSLAVFSILLSCEKDPDPTPVTETKGTLNVQFRASFGSQPLSLNSPYTTYSNYRVQPENLKYLVHHINTKMSGNIMEIKDAFLVDHSNSNNSFSVQLEKGSYDGLQFSIGVDSSMNHDDPALLPPTHPFSINMANDMFWSWSSGYIFMKYEGRADTTGTGTGALDHLFVFHTGADTLFRELTFFSSPFTITAGETKTLYIDLDVEKLLVQSSDTIDLKVDHSTHTMNNFPLALRFTELYKNAFSIY